MGTTLSQKLVKIRKPRTCFCCSRKFPEGTSMHYWSVVSEDGFGHGYDCLTCHELISQKLIDSDMYEGYQWGCVSEVLRKDETPEKLLFRLQLEKNERTRKVATH